VVRSDSDPADTIYALSSGRPPAAIGIIRISGPRAGDALARLAGALPEPRQAVLRLLRDENGAALDRALALWFPGPGSATGEDLAELHVHGGRAVIEAVLAALGRAGLRLAEPGEFTRRALFNGRIDLAETEGLGDLLAAETESQRREALARANGALSRKLEGWTRALLDLAARIEAAIDYDDEMGTAADAGAGEAARALAAEIGRALAVPPAERLRDGLRVVIAGPPNAGKSSLFNALIGSEAAIVSAVAGTTRDAIERPIALKGVPIVLVDTAGLRESGGAIERIGVRRAIEQQALADIVIQLGPASGSGKEILISAKADRVRPEAGRIATSAVTGEGLTELVERIVVAARTLLPGEGEVALDRRYREALAKVRNDLDSAAASADMVLAAEHVRHARAAIDALTGRAGVEDMLDALFGRFCLGK